MNNTMITLGLEALTDPCNINVSTTYTTGMIYIDLYILSSPSSPLLLFPFTHTRSLSLSLSISLFLSHTHFDELFKWKDSYSTILAS